MPVPTTPTIPFSSLPLEPVGPPYNAWGRYGSSDQLGTLNMLTPSTVAAAARTEIRTGTRVSLDWPLSKPTYPSYGRDRLKHVIRRRGPEGRVVNDDVLEFNTQVSSQWDGLRHYGYLNAQRYYNNTTDEQLHSSPTLGIDAFASSGGIMGRGILLDYASWAEANSIQINPLTSTSIPLTHLQRLIASHNIALSPGGGDILFIRSGLTAAFDKLDDSSQCMLSERPTADFAGVEATEEVLKWLWDSKFAAVAGDMPAFERSPPGGGKSDAYPAEEATLQGVGSLHEVLLGGWGCPIGEMFDLEALAELCKKEARWSFFVSSVPLKTRRQQHAATQPPNPAQDARARLYGILSTTKSPSEDEAGRVNNGIKNKSPQPAESETAASTLSRLKPNAPTPEARKLQRLLHEKFVAQRREDAASVQFAEDLERRSHSGEVKAKPKKWKPSKAEERKRQAKPSRQEMRRAARINDALDAIPASVAVPEPYPKTSMKEEVLEERGREPEKTSWSSDSVDLRQTSEPETGKTYQASQQEPSRGETKRWSILAQLKNRLLALRAAVKGDESVDQPSPPLSSSQPAKAALPQRPPVMPQQAATSAREPGETKQETDSKKSQKPSTTPQHMRVWRKTTARAKSSLSPISKGAKHGTKNVLKANTDSNTLVRKIDSSGSKMRVRKFDSQSPMPKRVTKRVKLNGTREVQVMDAGKLSITALDIKQPPVPRLSYGLERVLFNPGVYHLQDPRSRVYNFDPYLQTIMPAKEFDFNALKEYITSSRDVALQDLAESYQKRYVGSSSSMTGVLAHFHFLLSQWRPINTKMLSREFPEQSVTEFTEIQRSPDAIFLKWRNGSYAIDADKQFANANILMMLGKSMEKLLTLDTEDFEKYRKSNPDKVPEEKRKAPEAYHYSTMNDFIMRSQLDAYDSRLPGTGMFDLKTRAVVSVRMEASKYEEGSGYQIKSRQGAWESFEREYFDMIRSAFLKYSLQVRMGRMDGIFVAFHNTGRIFGFQYVSLAEMDSTLHGQWDINLGDQEFKLSVALLNKVLDKATKKYPNTSLRLHFETRKARTPFMYIFAEPVTEEQIEAIQTAKNAEIQKFEDEICGNQRGRKDGEETGESWDSLEANVQDAMDEDIRDPNHEDGMQDLDPKLADSERRASGGEASVKDHSATGEDANEESIVIENGEEASDGFENEGLNKQESAVEEGEDDGDGGDAEIEEEDEPNQDDEHQMLNREKIADQGRQGSDSLSKDMESSGASSNHPEGSKVEPDSREQEPVHDNGSAAGAAAVDAASQPARDTGSQSSGPQVLALTLTVRNLVNGSSVLRPVHLQPDDQWTVEYSLDEVPTAERAWSLYQACQVRREKKLDEDKAHRKDNDYVNGYITRLREMSRNGAVWREKQDEMDKDLPVKVLGLDT
ncbi:MAG: hypothetical protein LQ345_003229 [Seirophora villosa]|nr:MAG: hypothetical protein LQ345_003229 [Seirophora villosa]